MPPADAEPKIEAGRRRPRIGVFLDWLADGYSDPMLDEIVLAAGEADCDLLCFVGGLGREDSPRVTKQKPLAYADRQNIDAALVVSLGSSLTSEQIAAVFQELEPMPICSVAVPWQRYHSVEVDNESGVRQGVRHLIRAHGRRRIACIRGPENSDEADLRYEAYRQTLEQYDIEHDPALVTSGKYIRAHGIEAVRTLCDERGVAFDALVAANDAMALGALEELYRRGLHVPENVALLGFDDIEAAKHALPPLSSVRQPLRRHARRAFGVLLDRLQGKEVPKRQTVVAELVLRRSCGCVVAHAAASSAPPPAVRPLPGESPQRLAARVLEPVSSQLIHEDAEGAERLVRSFSQAVLETEPRQFLRQMEGELDRLSATSQDVLQVFASLREVRRRAPQLLSDPAAQRTVDALVHEIAGLAADAATRAEAVRRHQQEALFSELARTGEALVSAIDLPALQRALTENLERFGIRSCFVCAYDEEAVPSPTSRVVVACDTQRPIDLLPGGLRFATKELLPRDFLPADRRSTLLFCPLLRRDETSPGYVVFERGVAGGYVYDGLLDQIGAAYKRIDLFAELLNEVRRREAAERERLEKEMRIATAIQTGVLPRSSEVDGLEISAVMVPATEVGGDYYDVVPFEGGCWIGIGDVAGHGLPTGLVMLMLQSVLGGLARANVQSRPAQVLAAANELLFDNIRRRMHQDEHVTLTLIRYERSGRLCYAGAHEDIFVCRAEDGRVEQLETPGMWLGITRDIRPMTEELEGTLKEGDVMLLYTDGATEARNDRGEMFGPDRLAGALQRHRALPVQDIRDAILEEVQGWTAKQTDDVTLFVARQRADATYTSVSPSERTRA